MKRPAFLLVCLPLTACFTLSPSVSTSRCENCFRFVFILLAVHDFFFERLRPSSPVCGSPVSLRMSSIESFQKSEDVIPRKAVSASLAAALITFLNPQNAFANGAGAWAKHDGPFTDSDFAGFSATASGLKFYDVEVGSGPVPKPGQKIKAHYSGYLLTGKKFDSSYDRGQPLPFNVGVGQVIVCEFVPLC